MQKWSLENPSLMAQAGLMAQAAPVALRESSSLGADEYIGSEFLGSKKSKLKKIKELNKKLVKLHGGRPGMAYMPMPAPLPHFAPRGPGYPQVYPAYPPGYYQGASGYGTAHHNQRPNQAHQSNQHHPPKPAEQPTSIQLLATINSKLATYKQEIVSEKARLQASFDKTELGMKDTVVHILNSTFTFLESPVNPQKDQSTYTGLVSYINNTLLDHVTNNYEYIPIKFKSSDPDHGHVTAPDFNGVPTQFRKTWASGYLIRETIKIMNQFITVNSKGKPIPPYIEHIKGAAQRMRHERESVTFAIRQYEHKLKQEKVETSKPGATTARPAQRLLFGDEFEADAGAISMSNPYGL